MILSYIYMLVYVLHGLPRCMGTIVTSVVISLQWNIRTSTMDRVHVVDILSQFLWAGLEYHSDN